MKNLDKVMENINKALSSVDAQVREKISPLLKGYESVLLIVVVMMILVGLSSKMVIFGLLTLAVLLSPKYLPGVISKINAKKIEKSVEVKPEESASENKTEEKK